METTDFDIISSGSSEEASMELEFPKRQIQDNEEDNGKRRKPAGDPLYFKHIGINKYGILYVARSFFENKESFSDLYLKYIKKKIEEEIEEVFLVFELYEDEITKLFNGKLENKPKEINYINPIRTRYTDKMLFDLRNEEKNQVEYFYNIKVHEGFLYNLKKFDELKIRIINNDLSCPIKEFKYFIYYCYIIIEQTNDFNKLLNYFKKMEIDFNTDELLILMMGAINEFIPKLNDFSNEISIDPTIFNYERNKPIENKINKKAIIVDFHAKDEDQMILSGNRLYLTINKDKINETVIDPIISFGLQSLDLSYKPNKNDKEIIDYLKFIIFNLKEGEYLDFMKINCSTNVFRLMADMKELHQVYTYSEIYAILRVLISNCGVKNIIKIKKWIDHLYNCEPLRTLLLIIFASKKDNLLVAIYGTMNFINGLLDEENISGHRLFLYIYYFISTFYKPRMINFRDIFEIRSEYLFIDSVFNNPEIYDYKFKISANQKLGSDEQNRDYYKTIVGTNIFDTKLDTFKVSDMKTYFKTLSKTTFFFNFDCGIDEVFEFTNNDYALFDSLRLTVDNGSRKLKCKLKFDNIQEIVENLIKYPTFKKIKDDIEKDPIPSFSLMKYYLFFIVFYSNNMNYTGILYDMENYKISKEILTDHDALIARVNQKILFDNINKTYYLCNMNILQIEDEINTLKYLTFGYLNIYVIFYLNGSIKQRNEAMGIDKKQTISEINKDPNEKSNQFRRIIVPLKNLSDHFLTRIIQYKIDGIKIDDESAFFEEYKRTKANSSLLHSFDINHITRIEINLFDNQLVEREKITGRYLPFKLTKTNEIIEDFAYRSHIFTENNLFNPSQFNSLNCFSNAIWESNKEIKVFSEKELREIKINYGKGFVSISNIKNFCNDYNIIVTIYKSHVTFGKIKDIKNPTEIIKPLQLNECTRKITICFISYNGNGHFYPYYQLPISRYCLNNLNIFNKEYHDISEKGRSVIENKEITKYSGIKRINNKMKSQPWGNTYLLMERLVKDELFSPLSAHEILTSGHNNNNDFYSIEDLNLFDEVYQKEISFDTGKLSNNKKKFINTKPKEEVITDLCVADTETFTSKDKNIIPYCICLARIVDGKRSTEYFYGNYCQLNFLNYCIKNGIKKVYFHNLKFDGWLFKTFRITSIIYHASRLYSLTIGILRNNKLINVKLVDSLSLIPTKLKNFNKMFELGEVEKELFPYELITEESLEEKYLNMIDIKNYFNETDYNEFLNQNKALINNNKIDIKKLTVKYCSRDCEVLLLGLNKFQDMTKELFNISGLNFLTISGMSYYVMKQNCFLGMMEENGDLKCFLRRCVRGGRCMIRDNIKTIVNSGNEIVDFDACSLYPSAMKRLLLPTGKASFTSDKNYLETLFFDHLMDENQLIANDEKFVSAMFIHIRINKINKKRHFPLMCKKINGINIYTNNLENEEVYLTHIELLDLIIYQKIDFDIIDGIFFTGNKDDKMSNYIEYIYNLRKHYKEKKNPLQEILKLFMNSSYGKTIQKDIAIEDKFFTKDKSSDYIKNNFQRIKEVIEINDYSVWCKLEGTYSDEYHPVHIGALILSMSKHIMNELICLMEDNNISVFYQDTDSVHMYKKDIPKVQELFKLYYKRELIGTDMGQFHSDFPLINGKEAVSKKSIFLGKKCYIDYLINEDGETMNFIRMKGIPSKCVENAAKDLGVEVYDLYAAMYDGEEIEFDLLSNNLPSFEYEKAFGIKLRESFKRVLKFN